MLCLYMNEKTAVRCHFFFGVCVCCVLVPVRHVILSAVFGAASRAVRCREWLVATKEEPSRVRMK